MGTETCGDRDMCGQRHMGTDTCGDKDMWGQIHAWTETYGDRYMWGQRHVGTVTCRETHSETDISGGRHRCGLHRQRQTQKGTETGGRHIGDRYSWDREGERRMRGRYRREILLLTTQRRGQKRRRSDIDWHRNKVINAGVYRNSRG